MDAIHKENSMNTCKTCNHWCVTEKYDRRNIPDAGTCSYVVMAWKAMEFVNNDDEPYQLVESCMDQKAFVTDASDYDASLITRSDFGCVAYKPKRIEITFEEFGRTS
jgi:hypothetical protein